MKPLLIATLITICIAASGPCFGVERVLQEWDFAKATDTLGWKSAETIDELKTADGAMAAKAASTPIKLESPLFEMDTTPLQYIEIEMKTDADGLGVVYYSNTSEEPYHGFREKQQTTFNLRNNGGFQKIMVLPFWQRYGKITHIRIDTPGKQAQIRAVRIIGITGDSPVENPQWEFKGTSAKWWSVNSASKCEVEPNCWSITGNSEGMLLSPLVKVNADDNLWATVRIASKTAHTVQFCWATDSSDGLCSVPIKLRGDEAYHSYTVDLGQAPEWTGSIVALGIRPASDGKEASIQLQSVAVAPEPVGPPELTITSFGPQYPMIRTGEKFKLIAVVKNTGGKNAQALSVAVAMPNENSGNVLMPRRMSVLEPGKEMACEWEVEAKGDQPQIAVCRANAYDLVGEQKSVYLNYYPPLDKSKVEGLKYVPEPKPVSSDYLVGCYYFPGWYSYDRWAVLNDYPERKPVLGYYREGDPEVADWQIKWALEHGINFWIYDWYWTKGGRMLEHGIHDAFFKSRYGEKMKFCLLWANHNPAGTSSDEDLMAVTKYWIDNYFNRPNYLKLGGKNVMVIFSPGRLTEDMGADAVEASFAKMKKMCEDAGVGGLYLVACTYPDPNGIKQLEYEGYDALSGYNYPNAGDKGQVVAPYEWMVDGYKDFWKQIDDAASIPYIPLCEPGWDSRPWHGPNARVRTGKSPEMWEQMLANAKGFADTAGRALPEGKKVVFLEAWNEFGEGDYIEPHAQFGFDYLEAVRTVFAPQSPKPDIIVPRDLGMGPYDLSKPSPRMAWDFSKPEDRAWYAANMANPSYEGGALKSQAKGGDPMISTGGVEIDAGKFKTLEIKMKTDKDSQAQVFFARPNGRIVEERSARFDIKGDGQFRVYEVDMSKNPGWRGIIGSLRFDPTNEPDADIEIAYIKAK